MQRCGRGHLCAAAGLLVAERARGYRGHSLRMASLAWASKVKRRTFEQEDVEDRHADGFDSLLAQTSYVPVPWRHRNRVDGVRMGKVFAIMHKVQRDARLRMVWTRWTRAVTSEKVQTAQPARDHVHLREGLQVRPDADSQSD